MGRIVVFLLLILVAGGCSSKPTPANAAATPLSSSGDISMAMTLDPSPPKQGNETITVTLTYASGQPVKGATVTIATNMPQMSMSGPSLTPQDNGDGTYSAVANLNFATKWVFDVRASADGKSATAAFAQVVK